MFIIRKGVKGDCSGLVELAKGLNTFYRNPKPIKMGIKELEEYGFDDQIDKRLFQTFVAELTDNTKQLIGYALVYNSFTTWGGRGVFMEDLYINEKYRGSGVGTGLLAAVAQYTIDLGFDRLDWNVGNWNPKGMAFYKSLGAIDVSATEGTLSYRMNAQQLEQMTTKVHKN